MRKGGRYAIKLTADQNADLAAVAAVIGCEPGELLSRLAVQWIGERAAMAGGSPTAYAAKVEAARQVAAQRFAILDAWKRAGAPRRTFWGVALSTIYNWDLLWQGGGVAALADKRLTRMPAPRPPDPFLIEVRRAFMLRPRPRRQLTTAYRATVEKAKGEGWTVRSYKTCQRFIGTIRKRTKPDASGAASRPANGRPK